jgi:CDP-diacylglycerol--glycerol-3-phosphate 3-phosphatidyltransferase
MKKYIPNTLTFLRIILVPVFIWFMFFAEFRLHTIAAAVVFIFASITDYLDGMLARRFQVVTNIGKIMDPLADKILVISALIALSRPEVDLIAATALLIIVFREVAITIVRYFLLIKHRILASRLLGKIKTIFQLTGIISALVYNSFITVIPNILNETAKANFEFGFKFYFWLVTFLTVISGLTLFFRQKNKES